MKKKYGIPYQGSKQGIAEDIIKVLPKGERLVDLFGGGGAISHCAALSNKWNKIVYNDFNPLLKPFFEDIMRGNYNFDNFDCSFIDRETFNNFKNKDGYIKYIWSFGNNGKSYLYSKATEGLKEMVHNYIVYGEKENVLKKLNDIDDFFIGKDINQKRLLFKKYINLNKFAFTDYSKTEFEALERSAALERLSRLQTIFQDNITDKIDCYTSSYLDYVYQDGDVVYCDPPYENTYQYDEEFDSKRFYDWAKNAQFPVFFSSYEVADSNFKIIWSKQKRVTMSTTKGKSKEENLYINPFGYKKYYKN